MNYHHAPLSSTRPTHQKRQLDFSLSPRRPSRRPHPSPVSGFRGARPANRPRLIRQFAGLRPRYHPREPEPAGGNKGGRGGSARRPGQLAPRASRRSARTRKLRCFPNAAQPRRLLAAARQRATGERGRERIDTAEAAGPALAGAANYRRYILHYSGLARLEKSGEARGGRGKYPVEIIGGWRFVGWMERREGG